MLNPKTIHLLWRLVDLPALHHKRNVLQNADIFKRIAFDSYDIGKVTGGNGARPHDSSMSKKITVAQNVRFIRWSFSKSNR